MRFIKIRDFEKNFLKLSVKFQRISLISMSQSPIFQRNRDLFEFFDKIPRTIEFLDFYFY